MSSMKDSVDQSDYTLEYYENNAEAFTASTLGADMAAVRRRFLSRLPAGARILDFGCGSGRDSRAFLDMGYKVFALDGSAQLCRIAGELTGLTVRCLDFRDYVPAADERWLNALLEKEPEVCA